MKGGPGNQPAFRVTNTKKAAEIRSLGQISFAGKTGAERGLNSAVCYEYPLFLVA